MLFTVVGLVIARRIIDASPTKRSSMLMSVVFILGFANTAVLDGEACKDQCLSEMNGLVKCKVLPPPDLYHPVLPVKANNKLMFGLCRTCINESSQDSEECTHDEEQRALIGTWVIDEVNKALEESYKVLETYEIWAYDTIYTYLKRLPKTPVINGASSIGKKSTTFLADCFSFNSEWFTRLYKSTKQTFVFRDVFFLCTG